MAIKDRLKYPDDSNPSKCRTCYYLEVTGGGDFYFTYRYLCFKRFDAIKNKEFGSTMGKVAKYGYPQILECSDYVEGKHITHEKLLKVIKDKTRKKRTKA